MLGVKFINQQKQIRVNGLIDSGADQILLNKEIASFLGIQWGTGIKSVTIGINGTQEITYLHEIEMEVINLSKSRRKVWVGFVDLPAVGALLGQAGFFQNYFLRFRYDIKSLEIDVIKPV
jgi:hypothetical protein